MYIGDIVCCLYGFCFSEEVWVFIWEMINYLIVKDIKMLVIVCNMVMVVVLDEI